MQRDLRTGPQAELQKARLLEERGQLEAAAEAYVILGALADAVRVFVRLKRPLDAAKLVLKGLGPITRQTAANPTTKKMALTAAKLLAEAGQAQVAAKIYRTLGVQDIRSPHPDPLPGGEGVAGQSTPILLSKPAPNAREEAFAPGSTIANRYRLEAKLGEGGAGTVFRVTDLELSEVVALKVLERTTDDAQALANFRQELKLTRQLTHPNVIKLFDIGIHRGYRFITMEVLKGHDLRSLLDKPIEVAKGLGYLSQACAGIQAAHDLGVIHRDIKPENLFVTNDGVLKVMDFGIARQSHGGSVDVGGNVAGTPAYISPEQINEFEKVGPSADLYSLGAVAYEMFAGSPPFLDSDPIALLRAHLEQPPERPSVRNPNLPPEVEEIILKLLEKSPARRYRSCRELSAAIEPIRQRYAVEDFF